MDSLNGLIGQDIIVIARWSNVVGSRVGEFLPLPDTLEKLLARTRLVEEKDSSGGGFVNF